MIFSADPKHGELKEWNAIRTELGSSKIGSVLGSTDIENSLGNMPGYEVMALFRRMARPDTAAGIKRVAEELIKQGTLVRKVESLGERKLAFKIKE